MAKGGSRAGSGRKKGKATLESEAMRNMIAEQLHIHFKPIVLKAIDQAKEGNKDARDWLTDRAFGKASQSLAITGNLNIAKVLDELS
jgi:hypothetical protein